MIPLLIQKYIRYNVYIQMCENMLNGLTHSSPVTIYSRRFHGISDIYLLFCVDPYFLFCVNINFICSYRTVGHRSWVQTLVFCPSRPLSREGTLSIHNPCCYFLMLQVMVVWSAVSAWPKKWIFSFCHSVTWIVMIVLYHSAGLPSKGLSMSICPSPQQKYHQTL